MRDVSRLGLAVAALATLRRAVPAVRDQRASSMLLAVEGLDPEITEPS